MPLIVETGSNVTNANTIVDEAFVSAYHLANGAEAWAAEADITKREEAIIRANSRLSAEFTLTGTKTNGRAQSLFLPRTGMVDCEGISIGSTEIPIEFQRAAAEYSLLELLNPSSLTATAATTTGQTTGFVKKLRQKIGELEEETEYEVSGSTTVNVDSLDFNVLDRVKSLLKCFGSYNNDANSNSLLFGENARG